ncbi:MAG: nuclease-related domain-containing protein [Chloroflexota bacterium]
MESRGNHDRRVPGTRGNIDHIIVAPASVFVVDARAYVGLIEVRNYGWCRSGAVGPAATLNGSWPVSNGS